MAPNSDTYIDKLKDISSIDDSGLSNVVAKSLLLPVVAFFTASAKAIGAAFEVPIATFEGLSAGATELLDGIFGVGTILDTGAEVSAQSLQSGVWAQAGPFTFVVAVIVISAAAMVLARVRENPSTGNVVGFLPFDIPFLGTEEEGD